MELNITLDTTEGKKNIKYSYIDKILLITTVKDTTVDIRIDINGTKRYYLDDKLHRVDGPAIEYADGTKEYYLDDKRHRVDGPAIEGADGSKRYYLDGKRHRVGGPAIEYANGSKYYYVDGKRHRVGGPAIEGADGSKYYYLDDKLHRVDGPAEIVMNDGKVVKIAKWINGILINELTF